MHGFGRGCMAWGVAEHVRLLVKERLGKIVEQDMQGRQERNVN